MIGDNGGSMPDCTQNGRVCSIPDRPDETPSDKKSSSPGRVLLSQFIFFLLLLGNIAMVPIPAHAESVASTGQGPQSTDIMQLRALHAADQRLATIFWRISTGNVALCDPTRAAIGVLLHARSSYEGSYRDAAQKLFHFAGEVAVESVFADGPAATAGLEPNDTIIAVNGSPLGDEKGPEAVAAADRAIATAGRGGVVRLTIIRNDERHTIAITPRKACPGRVELDVESGRGAETDGKVIQVSTAMVNAVPSDDQLAAILAHEYSHVILRHPERLTAAGVHRGLLSVFGKSHRLIRLTEEQADRLSVYLMVNAGYDPMAASRFWHGVGRQISGGFLSSGTHMGWKQRAEMTAREARKALAMPTRPAIPAALLETRNKPLK